MEGEGKLAAPRRAHLQRLADQGDLDAEAELDADGEPPELAAHVWAYFHDIRRTPTGGGGMGPAYLTRHDIHAWEADEAIRLAPWERRAILKLDAALLASVNREEA